ncbi:uncharacterized protein LOC110728758 isoform X2 [Chenopodium quinoa]|uniref:uncharacterized protein LOC110728758 isoform X2 n=1 Tax=Chenopodium quinoa TaxID=63459 RepID=UPI000B78B8DB|nr:uncharacterized protein LOC110728758 isoform X2 [Chenopodium quinoa]
MMRSIERNRKRKKQRLKKTNDKPQNNPIQSPLNSVELPEELIFSEILPRLPVVSQCVSLCSVRKHNQMLVSMLSLTKEWKQIHDHGLDHCVSFAKTNPGVVVNDTLYWIMATRDPTRKNVIVGFNLKLEKFDEIPGLFPRSAGFHDHFLCVMGGCLSLCSSNMHKESYLSMMKQSGEVVELISLSSNSKSWSYSSLVGFTRTGKSIVVSKSWELALVDLNSSPKQYIPLVTFEEARKPYMVGYFPSLIPPFVV